jgi:glycyl-tRNA synthetase beta subunit
MLVLACLIAAPLVACTPDQLEEQAENTSRLSGAEKVLADIKAKLAKEVKPEYFESDEWKAFVDAYWEGYNQGQEQMKEPEYKDMTDIQY